jgi:osmotically-inducible protein OsmY
MGGERRMGRPPRGYQRPDERIREEICDRLIDHEWIDASDVDVRVQNGEVTLIGVVMERQAKRSLEDLAESILGVKEVHNQIRVKREDIGVTSPGMATTGATTATRSANDKPNDQQRTGR